MQQVGRVPLHCRFWESEEPLSSLAAMSGWLTDFRFGVPACVTSDIYSTRQFIGLCINTQESRTTICMCFALGGPDFDGPDLEEPDFEPREACMLQT